MTKQNHFHNILSGSLFPTEVARSSSFDGVKAETFLCGISYGMRVPVAVKLVANCHTPFGWLSSRVVSVLDSSAEGPRFKSKSQCSRVTVLGKLFTPIVHQAANLVVTLLRVVGVTAGLAESNGSLPSGDTALG